MPGKSNVVSDKHGKPLAQIRKPRATNRRTKPGVKDVADTMGWNASPQRGASRTDKATTKASCRCR